MSYRLFEAGIKPALLLPYRGAAVPLAERYPSIRFLHRQNIMIFNNAFDAHDFMAKGTIVGRMRGTGELILDYKHYETGIALGFPPSAVTAFDQEIPQQARVMFNYHGIVFATHETLVEENLEWLNQRYDIPIHLQTSVTLTNWNKEQIAV